MFKGIISLALAGGVASQSCLGLSPMYGEVPITSYTSSDINQAKMILAAQQADETNRLEFGMRSQSEFSKDGDQVTSFSVRIMIDNWIDAASNFAAASEQVTAFDLVGQAHGKDLGEAVYMPMEGKNVSGVIFDGFGNFAGIQFDGGETDGRMLGATASPKKSTMMVSKVQSLPVTGDVKLVGLRSIKECATADKISAIQLILMANDKSTCAQLASLGTGIEKLLKKGEPAQSGSECSSIDLAIDYFPRGFFATNAPLDTKIEMNVTSTEWVFFVMAILITLISVTLIIYICYKMMLASREGTKEINAETSGYRIPRSSGGLQAHTDKGAIETDTRV